MVTKTESTSRSIIRSIAMGALLSMVFMYAVHVFGTWNSENYRPHSQTTFTLLLYNKCAVFGDTHILRPNTGISSLASGVDGTKLTGSFMNFFDGHIVSMTILSVVLGGAIFAIRKTVAKKPV